MSRSSLSAAELALDLLERGATVRSRRSPASVGATLRVVAGEQPQAEPLLEALMVWLSADCETPELRGGPGEAALLRHHAKAARSLKFSVAFISLTY